MQRMSFPYVLGSLHCSPSVPHMHTFYSTRTESSRLSTGSSRYVRYRTGASPAAHFEHTEQNIPNDPTTLKEELAKIKARNMERKAQREAEARAAHLAQQAAQEQKSTGRSWWPWGEYIRCPLVIWSFILPPTQAVREVASSAVYRFIALVMTARVAIVFLRTMHTALRSIVPWES